jgi:hypothetical protein
LSDAVNSLTEMDGTHWVCAHAQNANLMYRLVYWFMFVNSKRKR